MAGDGSVVILGRDDGNDAWWELEQLSQLTGWPLLAIDDLARDGDRVVRRADASRVDVIYRRTNDDRLRDDGGGLTALGRLLLEPLRAGTVRVLNGFGSGIADDKRTYPYVEKLVRFYCGEEPLLRSIPAWDLGVDEQRQEALARLDELVFKPRAGAGGEGIVLAPRASREELRALRRKIERDPASWIAQEPVLLSTHPTVVDGRLEPRHVDLRPFVIGGRVLPGGLSRFAQAAGELVVNCARGGGGKDVWVLDG
jgi:carboxylate-amine ligase